MLCILKFLDFQSSVDVAPFAFVAYCSVTAFVFQLFIGLEYLYKNAIHREKIKASCGV